AATSCTGASRKHQSDPRSPPDPGDIPDSLLPKTAQAKTAGTVRPEDESRRRQLVGGLAQTRQVQLGLVQQGSRQLDRQAHRHVVQFPVSADIAQTNGAGADSDLDRRQSPAGQEKGTGHLKTRVQSSSPDRLQAASRLSKLGFSYFIQRGP